MASENVELIVRRDTLSDTRITRGPLPDLADGTVLAAIDKFGLTANNITYGVVGERIGYWNFFPTPDPAFGKIPVWGFATIVASRHDEVPVGTRLYGYFPMSSHVTLTPTRITKGGLIDGALHRAQLPAVYNAYARTNDDGAELSALEDARCLYFPLFSTSFVLYDYLVDNDWFGVSQVVIASASSKTAFGLACLLARHEGARPRVIGLTSARNTAFVTGLGFYDEVYAYDAVDELDASQPAALIDMSGDGPLLARLHHHFGENVKLSSGVGVTHWQAERMQADLPGAKPRMFFAPAQFAKRDQDWGPGEARRRAGQASIAIIRALGDKIRVSHHQGAASVEAAFSRMLSGQVGADEGLILSLVSTPKDR